MKIKPSENIPRLERRLVRRMRAVETATPETIAQNRRRLLTAKNDLFKAELRRKATPAERMVIRYFKIIGVKHWYFQKGFFSPWHIIADFYFPRRKLILEIDGGYHKRQPAKDFARDAVMWERRGIRTIRVTNEQVFSGDYKMILAKEGICDSRISEGFSTKWIS